MGDKKPKIERSEGLTASERYLGRLCDRTFLSLWSYPGIYRDQGRSGKGDGKEVCDLLVVFENHILIFSDKHCVFPTSGDLKVDWCRWFRKAVLASANQVWGAERWIKFFPNTLYIDKSCTQAFPIDLPDLKTAKFHRIVVAHNASWRCRAELGGSGSLMLMPRITGSDHYDPQKAVPFAVGQIETQKGYVHVFDYTSLNLVLNTLSTVTDFVNYLTKKEQFVASGRLGACTGEEDLLACYLGKLNKEGEHDFVFDENADFIFIDSFWEDFKDSPERRSQLHADEISYTWDRIIEKFARHIRGGTSLYNSHPRFADQIVPLRFMAREPRTRRRLLSESLIEFLEKTPLDNMRATRVMLPSKPGEPYYVFLLLSVPDHKPIDEYREVRRRLLEQLCMTAKLQFPDALDIVGFATEPGLEGGKTEDAIYLDAREWPPELQAEAEEVREELGLLKTLTQSRRQVREYPRSPTKRKNRSSGGEPRAGSLRNSLCPCGSGLKFKKCCGRSGR